ncbi:hypothetical protein TNCV_3358421 [Trichonephila clavipes]|nr:hypothetical protein TNCV_3358421 [Trichonephila clavipes]
MKQVYSDCCLSRSNVFVWHKRFLDGRDAIEDDQRSERPISSRTPEIFEKLDLLKTVHYLIKLLHSFPKALSNSNDAETTVDVSQAKILIAQHSDIKNTKDDRGDFQYRQHQNRQVLLVKCATVADNQESSLKGSWLLFILTLRGHGCKFVPGVVKLRFRVLVPLTIRRVEGLMYIHSEEAQRPGGAFTAWGTLSSRRTTSPLVRLVEGKERSEAPKHPQGVLRQN